MRTARGAFVLQVDDVDGMGDGRLTGRIEHVISGRAVEITSVAALLDFIATTIAPITEQELGPVKAPVTSRRPT